MGIVKAVAHFLAYGNMMAYPMISSTNAFRDLMFGYGVIAAFMSVWAIITVKETDNLTLVEIERSYWVRLRNSFRRVRNSFRKGKAPNDAANETVAKEDAGLESAPLLMQ